MQAASQGVARQGVDAKEQAAQAARMQLIIKRDELREQMKELTRRRNELQEQRQGANQAQASEISSRITVIDRRSGQIEAQLFATNDAIANGLGGPGSDVAVADAAEEAAEAAAQAGTTQPDPDDLIDATRGAVEDAVFGSFAAGVTTLLAFMIAWRGFRRFVLKKKPVAAFPDNSAQIAQLQQSMDAIAIEVERISEAQRYTAKMLNDRQKASLT